MKITLKIANSALVLPWCIIRVMDSEFTEIMEMKVWNYTKIVWRFNVTLVYDYCEVMKFNPNIRKKSMKIAFKSYGILMLSWCIIRVKYSEFNPKIRNTGMNTTLRSYGILILPWYILWSIQNEPKY